MVKVRRILALILCLVLLGASSLTVHASPRLIMINNARDLLKLAQNCRLDDYSRELTVVLAADIDLTGTDFSPIPIFSGSFHGNGFRITGLALTPGGSAQGFFRTLTATAEVTDLHLEGNIAPWGSSSDVGGIAGINHGKITNCTFTGTVSGMNRAGGIVGTNGLTGIIDRCSTSGNVHATHFAGGIAGSNQGVIRDCTNYAPVNTTVEQNSVSIEDITLDALTGSEAATTVTDIGGIAGTGTGILRNCVNMADVGYPQIGYNIGGIAGSYSGYITGCSNHGNIRGRKEVGGILGQLEPAVLVNYAQDTVQILQGQLSEMSGTAASVGGHMQSGTNALSGFSDQLEEQIKNAQDALALLSPDPDNPQMPDMDTLEAARIALGSSLSGISNALSSLLNSGMNAVSGLTQDIQSLTNQMTQVGGTIGSAADGLGGKIADLSDADTQEDTSAKLDGCRNLGTVEGDWNIGGIVGAMALENDLDPESDLQLIGTTSFNFDVSLRAVVTDCANEATVTGKKQNAGGIVGWGSLGLVKNCVNTATVDAANATYAGGIAGQSLGFIRSCNAKCTVLGKTYVGGIAGTGATVSHCRSIVYLEDPQEKFGAVLGVLGDAQLDGNYYLDSQNAMGAIDGISYSGKAQGLDADAFFGLDGIPGAFRLVNLTFVFNDGSIQKTSLPYGSPLATVGFPKIPEDAGSDARWEGPISLQDDVTRDVTFRISATAHIQTLESQQKDADGYSQILLQGQFRPGAAITVNSIREDGYIMAWGLILPESLSDMKLRCRLPQGCSSEDTQAELRLADGTWQAVETHQQGSYLIMDLPGSVTGLRLLHTPASSLPYLILGVALALLLTVAVVTVVSVKKKRKK